MADFEMFAGDTKVFEVTVKDEAGNPVDLSNVDEIRWEASKSVNARPAALAKSKGSGITIVDGPAGRFNVTLDSADTEDLRGQFYYEAEMDEGNVVSTIMSGTMIINPALIKPVTP